MYLIVSDWIFTDFHWINYQHDRPDARNGSGKSQTKTERGICRCHSHRMVSLACCPVSQFLLYAVPLAPSSGGTSRIFLEHLPCLEDQSLRCPVFNYFVTYYKMWIIVKCPDFEDWTLMHLWASCQSHQVFDLKSLNMMSPECFYGFCLYCRHLCSILELFVCSCFPNTCYLLAFAIAYHVLKSLLLLVNKMNPYSLNLKKK